MDFLCFSPPRFLTLSHEITNIHEKEKKSLLSASKGNHSGQATSIISFKKCLFEDADLRMKTRKRSRKRSAKTRPNWPTVLMFIKEGCFRETRICLFLLELVHTQPRSRHTRILLVPESDGHSGLIIGRWFQNRNRFASLQEKKSEHGHINHIKYDYRLKENTHTHTHTSREREREFQNIGLLVRALCLCLHSSGSSTWSEHTQDDKKN